MSDKQGYSGVRRKRHASNKATEPITAVRLETAFQRAVASVQKMTSQQHRRSLIKAGILTPKGKLAPNYS